jgi:apolipoprotein N-acyltransferase
MKKIHLIILSMLSGVLFTIGWPVNGYPVFLFTAFIPLLIIEQYIFENNKNFSRFAVFFYTYPAFLIWNIATTWWIWNSTPVAVLAWILNAMFMSIVMNVFHFSRRTVYAGGHGYILLIIYWITFEYIHINWNLTWPWLNLGHGFAVYNRWIQWYEFTGILGGTLWVLAVNILFYKAYKIFNQNKAINRIVLVNGLSGLFLILIPLGISFLMYFSYDEKQAPVSIIVTQPNLDPYSEQYSIPADEVADLNLNLAQPLLDDQTSFIVAPESAIQESIWENNPDWSEALPRLLGFTETNPNVKIIIGASTFKRYQEEEPVPESARFHEKGQFFYDAFNTAFYIDSSGFLQIHHKSKLTPGVEYMPSWGPLKFIENFAINLGGTVGTLGRDKEQIPFRVNDTLSVAPLICYESVYGGFCNAFVRSKAQLIFVITNDGWWGNTPGHRQHLYFSPLRAVETRRSIARSANTGISCFIDQRGDIYQATRYWERDVITRNLNLNSKITFYVRFGDYIGRMAAFSAVLFILLSMVFAFRPGNKINR